MLLFRIEHRRRQPKKSSISMAATCPSLRQADSAYWQRLHVAQPRLAIMPCMSLFQQPE
jgi:hypothetical protein